MNRLQKAVALVAAGVASLVMVTIAEAGQAQACTTAPHTNVYCWPGGPVPPPHRP